MFSLKKLVDVFRRYDALLCLFSLLLIFSGLSRVVSFYSTLPEDPPVLATSVGNEDAVRVPIIMYHGILKDSRYWGRYVISPDLFEEDLKYLTENGYTTIVTQDLINYVEKGTPLPEKPVMLTFDDGYYNNYVYAYPLLQKYNCKAVISIIGCQSEKYSENGECNPFYTHLTWEQIKEMSNSGFVEIQNHSYDLHKTTSYIGAKKIRGESDAAYAKRLSGDLLKLQALLKENVGIEPAVFTYPFGAVSDASVSVLKDLGFKATLSCEEKVNLITRDPECLYRLCRFLRPSGKDSEIYFFKILPATETFSYK